MNTSTVPTIQLDTPAMVDFLVGLCNTPSPTGYTEEAIAYVQQALEPLDLPGLSLSHTRKGALLVHLDGRADQAPRALTAHVDTLGLMVKEIKGNGRLKVTQLGGYNWNAVEYEGVTVRTHTNQRYRGTVVPVNGSYHVNRSIVDMQRSEMTLEIRLDARTRSAAETRQLGIEAGDFVFLDPRVEVTDTGFIRSRHLDDKASVAAIYGALLALKHENLQPAQATTILITNYEEVGHGVTDLPENLEELLVIDMAAIGDGQTSDEYSVTLCAKDSSGPYHFEMNNKLRKLAAQAGIPLKVDIYPFYGSDGSMYWRSGGRARVGLIGPGVDSSHGYERTHQESLQHTAHLIAHYLLSDD